MLFPPHCLSPVGCSDPGPEEHEVVVVVVVGFGGKIYGMNLLGFLLPPPFSRRFLKGPIPQEEAFRRYRGLTWEEIHGKGQALHFIWITLTIIRIF